jgi:protein disulfide-isomerase
MLRHVSIGWMLFALLLAVTAQARSPRPYDEKADANAAIAALVADSSADKRILLVFGANWCQDSRRLEAHFRSAELAPLLAREFRVLHVDVGTFHRNLDITARYGDPIDKGIPSIVLLEPDGRILFATHGQLSSASKMKRAQVVSFFERLAADGHVD